MKHPILYRVVFYSCMLFLIAMNIYFLNITNRSPFNIQDMKLSYLNGCLIADDSGTNKCRFLADLYEESLTEISHQMEEHLDE
jgi:hypothetical protein